ARTCGNEEEARGSPLRVLQRDREGRPAGALFRDAADAPRVRLPPDRRLPRASRAALRLLRPGLRRRRPAAHDEAPGGACCGARLPAAGIEELTGKENYAGDHSGKEKEEAIAVLVRSSDAARSYCAWSFGATMPVTAMKNGDIVSVYPHGSPELRADAVVQI